MLKIEQLTIGVKGSPENKKIVKDFSLEIEPKRIVSLVGGSGSGKTTTGLAILRLLPAALSIESGSILFEGQNLLNFSAEQMRNLRGSKISMVFQEPLYAFNPVFQIADQIEEVLVFHTALNQTQRQKKVLELLDVVGIPDPERIARSYPHQLSGGLRQRAMIAQAIASDPKLIIADEPTSNLDVTLQARIIELFQKLKTELDLSILLITHDLGLVRHVADDVAVLTKGNVVEYGTAEEVFSQPRHEYTRQLMSAFE